MASACRSAAARLDAETEAALPLNYAKSEYGSAGYLTALAGFLTAAYGSPVFDDWLLTTNGVSHGLELAVGCLTKPGDVCWMESPSYFLAYQIFADHHLKVVGAPSDAHGLDVEALARCLADGTLGPPPAVLYLVPTHGNPTGVTLSRERREALLRLARQYGFVVLADEVYALLDWTALDQALPPRMLALDAPHRKRVQQEAEAKAVASSGGAPSAVRAARPSGGDTSYTPNVARPSGGNGGNGGSAEGVTPGAAESAAEAAAEAAAEEAEACGVVISVSSHTKILAGGEPRHAGEARLPGVPQLGRLRRALHLRSRRRAPRFERRRRRPSAVWAEAGARSSDRRLLARCRRLGSGRARGAPWHARAAAGADGRLLRMGPAGGPPAGGDRPGPSWRGRNAPRGGLLAR